MSGIVSLHPAAVSVLTSAAAGCPEATVRPVVALSAVLENGDRIKATAPRATAAHPVTGLWRFAARPARARLLDREEKRWLGVEPPTFRFPRDLTTIWAYLGDAGRAFYLRERGS